MRARQLAVAVGPPLLAALVQRLARDLVGPEVWLLFLPAVFASSWLGGRVAGLASTVVSTALVWWLFVPPGHAWIKPQAPLFPAITFMAAGLAFTVTHARMRRNERLIRNLFDQAGDGILVAGAGGRFTHVNEAGCRMLRAERSQILGRTLRDLVVPSDASRLDHIGERLNSASGEVSEWTMRRSDGSQVPVEMTTKRLNDGRWHAFMRDITDRRVVETRLRQAASVFDNTREGVIVTDRDRRIVAVNPAFTMITGFEADDAIGKDPGIQRSDRQDAAFYRRLWESLHSTGQWQGELWNRRKNGEIYPAWETISAVRDADGSVSHYVSLLSDITPLKDVQDRLNHLAHHDVLTGLANRLLFASHLDQAIEHARRRGSQLALLFVDLDRFKLINDSLGHTAGDDLLRVVARRLKEAVRAEDLVSRLGGDEFTLLIEEIGTAEDVAVLARKILAAVCQPTDIAGHEIVVTASVGIALYPGDADSTDALTRAADSAMYRAKERGRSTYDFYTRDITDRVLQHVRIESGLRHALKHGELMLEYQPQFDADTLRIVGVEALLRWTDASGSRVPPDTFIHVAEQSTLVNELGAWVLDKACAQLRAWMDRGLAPVRVAVNISGRHVLHDHLVDALDEALRRNGLAGDARRIELEITESVLHAVEESAAVLRRLRALGVMIAIDDFGTGFSSLSVLKHLPIDTLKIDGAFVRSMPDDSDGNAIVSAIISMAHTLGLRVIAEGVESHSQLRLLRSLRCDEVQGHLLGRPTSPEAVAELLRPRSG